MARRPRLSVVEPLPADVDSEKELLGAWLAGEQSGDVRPDHFSHPAHAAIARARRDLLAQGAPVGMASIAARLRDTGADAHLRQVGDISYLDELLGRFVPGTNVEWLADRIGSRAFLRSIAIAAEGWGAAARGDADAAELRERIRVEIEQLAPPARTINAWRSPADRARTLGGLGERVALSIDTLNRATRGGIPAGKIVIIGGAPGAGKTTGAVQDGVQLALRGVFVAIVAADEDADGLLVRVGQVLGFDRDKLEQGDAETRETLAEQLADLPNLMLVDLDEEQATVEEVSAELHKRASGAPTVLIVDSVQTARVLGLEDVDGPRARVDLVMAVLKREAKQRRHRVIATCELARGAYRSSSAADRIDDLAAFKESGGIEYGATIALVFRSVPGDGGLVDVSIPKNRLGRKLAYRMELSSARATFREVELPAEDAPSATQRMKERVLEVVAKSIAPITSQNELARRAKGKKQVVRAAIEELLEEGLLDHADGAFSIGSRGSRAVPGTAHQGSGSRGSPPLGREPQEGTGSRLLDPGPSGKGPGNRSEAER